MKNAVPQQELKPEELTETLSELSDRIYERVPDSSLYDISKKLIAVSRRSNEQVAWIEKPIIRFWLHVALLATLSLTIIIGFLTVCGIYPGILHGKIRQITAPDVQDIDAGCSVLIAAGIGIFFLFTLERRVKRHRVMKSLHALRSFAHLVDMHHLSKCPHRFLWEQPNQEDDGHKTVEMRQNELSLFQTARYLIYCNEMLSLISKIAVLYIQRFDDPISTSAVNEIETLTTGLSRKIWQTLMVMHRQQSV